MQAKLNFSSYLCEPFGKADKKDLKFGKNLMKTQSLLLSEVYGKDFPLSRRSKIINKLVRNGTTSVIKKTYSSRR